MGGHSVSVSSVSVSVLSLRTELTSQKNTAKQEEKSSVHRWGFARGRRCSLAPGGWGVESMHGCVNMGAAVHAAGDVARRQARCLEARSSGAAKSKEKGIEREGEQLQDWKGRGGRRE